MPVRFDFVGDVLRVRAIGTYPVADVETALCKALSDPDRPELRGALLDVRESEVIGKRTIPEIRDTSNLVAMLSVGFKKRMALLTCTDVQYGVMRMVAAWAEISGIDIAVFRDEAAALEWLGR